MRKCSVKGMVILGPRSGEEWVNCEVSFSSRWKGHVRVVWREKPIGSRRGIDCSVPDVTRRSEKIGRKDIDGDLVPEYGVFLIQIIAPLCKR